MLLFCYGYIHQDINSPIVTSRLNLLHAIISEGRLCIDSYTSIPCDRAFYNGHYYSDKAPGVVFASLPVFAGTKTILFFSGIDIESDDGWFYSSWIATFCSIGLITSIGGAIYLLWLRQWLDPAHAAWTTVILFLSVTVFPYATMMFSHAMVAGLLSIALWASVGLEQQKAQHAHNRWRDVIAGFCSGLALVSEYTSGICLVGIAVWIFLNGKHRILRFFGGAAVPVLLGGIYSWLCFDNALAIGYDYTMYKQMHKGFYGLHWPSTTVLFRYLFSPSHGLFFWCPALLLAFVGLPDLYLKNRRLFWIIVAVCTINILFMSGKRWDWQAGNSIGPRYLSPMIPFLGLPVALGVVRYPRLGFLAGLYGIMLTSLGTLVKAILPYYITNPLLAAHIPGLLNGKLSMNAGQVLGLPPLISVLAFYASLAFFAYAIIHEYKMTNSKVNIG